MWSKAYVGIVVILVLLFLNILSSFILKLQVEYDIENKYNIPVRCMSVAICGMTGNIFLLYLIYALIPDNYYENILTAFDPRQIHKTVDKKILGFN